MLKPKQHWVVKLTFMVFQYLLNINQLPIVRKICIFAFWNKKTSLLLKKSSHLVLVNEWDLLYRVWLVKNMVVPPCEQRNLESNQLFYTGSMRDFSKSKSEYYLVLCWFSPLSVNASNQSSDKIEIWWNIAFDTDW